LDNDVEKNQPLRLPNAKSQAMIAKSFLALLSFSRA
jgi:hypothetical protein